MILTGDMWLVITWSAAMMLGIIVLISMSDIVRCKKCKGEMYTYGTKGKNPHNKYDYMLWMCKKCDYTEEDKIETDISTN